MEAARHVAGGNRDDFPVFADNFIVASCFGALVTQWSIRADGRYIGLRYEAIPVVMDMAGIANDSRPAAFFGLRLMEGEALRVLNAAFLTDQA